MEEEEENVSETQQQQQQPQSAYQQQHVRPGIASSQKTSRINTANGGGDSTLNRWLQTTNNSKPIHTPESPGASSIGGASVAASQASSHAGSWAGYSNAGSKAGLKAGYANNNRGVPILDRGPDTRMPDQKQLDTRIVLVVVLDHPTKFQAVPEEQLQLQDMPVQILDHGPVIQMPDIQMLDRKLYRTFGPMYCPR